MSEENKAGDAWRYSGRYRFQIVKPEKQTGEPLWTHAGDYQYRVVKVGVPMGLVKSPAFNEIARRYESEKIRLKYLRRSFEAAAAPLARDIAGIYTQYQDKGTFKAVDIRENELEAAFKRGARAPFSNMGLESFPAKYKGVNRHWKINPDRTIEEIAADAKTWYMTWEKGEMTGDGRYVQRVVGSMIRNFTSDELLPLSQKKMDLALNVYAPDVGISGWLSTWVEFRTEMALISYELHTGEFMWIGQVLDDKLQPLFGEKAFWIFLEWIRPQDKAYYMYGVQLEIDFDNPRARLLEQGFRKAKFDRVG